MYTIFVVYSIEENQKIRQLYDNSIKFNWIKCNIYFKPNLLRVYINILFSFLWKYFCLYIVYIYVTVNINNQWLYDIHRVTNENQ